jgi:tRNA(Arg) A34 adenosine deaminase TadA
LRRALELSVENNTTEVGGPFGAVVARNGIVIAEGSNQVLRTQDPTAHAEIVVIREASATLGRFDLSDCELYSSCEPCPMCLGAIYWARLKAVYFANGRADAARAGFDDQFIYDEIPLALEERKIPLRQLKVPGAFRAFQTWIEKVDKRL